MAAAHATLAYLVTAPEPSCGHCKRHLLSHTGDTVPHVVCASCCDEQSGCALHLCVWCFANHPEFPAGHSSRTHPYRVGVNLEKIPSAVNPTWTMKETMAVIKGFKKFGYENWEDIASKALLGSKTPAECRDYFEELRIAACGGERFALPDMTAVDAASKARLAQITPLATSVGYMPLRDEFEIVHANDAEALLADMEFGGEDSADIDCGSDWTELKVKVLHNYNRKLDERQARKRFVLERDLLDFKRTQLAASQLAGSAEDAKLLRLVEPLARFASRPEYLELVQGLLRERNLRAEIRRLQDLRALGVRTLAEAEVRNRLLSRQSGGGSASAVNVDEVFPNAGSEHLNQSELAFCAQLHISPLHFIAIKDVLLREGLRSGAVKKSRVSNLVVDGYAGGAVLDFLIGENMVVGAP